MSKTLIRIVLATLGCGAGIFICSGGLSDETQMIQRQEYKVVGWIDSVQFSPDEKLVVACGNNGVWVWDRTSGKQLQNLTENMNAVAVLRDSNRVVCGGLPDRLELWDIAAGKKIFDYGSSGADIRSVAVSKNEKLLAAGRGFQQVKKMIDTGGTELQMGVALVDNGFDILVRDLNTGELVHQLKGHQGPISAMAFFQDDRQLVSVSDDNTVRLWDLKKGVELKCHGQLTPMKEGGNYGHVTLSISADENYAAIAGFQISMYLFDLNEWKIVQRFREVATTQVRAASCAFVPNSEYLIVGQTDGTLRVWDRKTWKEIARAQAFSNGALVHCVDVTADGKFALSGGEGAASWKGVDPYVRLWRLPTDTGHER